MYPEDLSGSPTKERKHRALPHFLFYFKLERLLFFICHILFRPPYRQPFRTSFRLGCRASDTRPYIIGKVDYYSVQSISLLTPRSFELACYLVVYLCRNICVGPRCFRGTANSGTYHMPPEYCTLNNSCFHLLTGYIPTSDLSSTSGTQLTAAAHQPCSRTSRIATS